MGKHEKLLVQVLRGGHHIFSREGMAAILNLQPRVAHAQAYPVRQVRHVILKYKLGGELNES